jgi:hypothetical protein
MMIPVVDQITVAVSAIKNPREDWDEVFFIFLQNAKSERLDGLFHELQLEVITKRKCCSLVYCVGRMSGVIPLA